MVGPWNPAGTCGVASASMRQMVAFTLRGAGFTVIEGENGQEALDKLTAAGGKVDLIVTDLNMPVMDGLTFIRQARTRPPGERLAPRAGRVRKLLGKDGECRPVTASSAIGVRSD